MSGQHIKAIPSEVFKLTKMELLFVELLPEPTIVSVTQIEREKNLHLVCKVMRWQVGATVHRYAIREFMIKHTIRQVF